MHLVLVALAMQLRTVALTGPAAPIARRPGSDAAADSVRDARRARSEQASFERARRAFLPWDPGGEGRCDVRVGRFCWWYDDASPDLPPESPAVVERRSHLIALFDSLSARHPGDDWMAGMTVHYRVDAHDAAGADSAARACGATTWWCHALLGYAAQVNGEAALADSAFDLALGEMPDTLRCEWTDIHTILPGDARDRYEKLPCAARGALESRYWLLSRPRLAAPANDWRTEFLARRVQDWLARRSLTPQALSWGGDAEELLLRYGWPVRWSRVQRSTASLTPDIGIIGHDPWPSFDFGPREPLLDSLAVAGDEGWEINSRQSDARYAPPGVRRVTPVEAQVARFRRGDSTLVVAAFSSTDDSLRAPAAVLAVALADGETRASSPDSSARGTARLVVGAAPVLAGVEITDSTSGTLARSRRLYSLPPAPPPIALSDLLLYRAANAPVELLDSALTLALPGVRVSRAEPVGVYWESYRPADGDSVEVAITVERIDAGFFRSMRQRLGLADEDSPLRMRWTDARAVTGGMSSYAVSLDLGNLSAGRYRLSLTITPAGAGSTSVTASRELELTDP
jgi:hypothetical protein